MSRSESFIRQLEEALEKNGEIEDCRLEFSKAEGPCGGFLSETSLATLTATNSNNNEHITFDVFIKWGKDQSAFGGAYDFGNVYMREVEAYSSVFPALSAYLKEKKVSFSLDFIPRCFGAFVIEGTAVVILENLIIQGYRLHDYLYPMNLGHVKMLFENYAKLHATAFALKDQNPEEYQRLTKNLSWIGEEYWQKEEIKLKYEIHNAKVCEILIEEGNEELAKRWKEHIKIGSYNIFCNIESFNVVETCVTQADCWNNNFLFKYNNTAAVPSEAKHVDFQMCQNNSPVLDLCTLFYFTCGHETEGHFEDLLDHYHRTLSSCLEELGSDPNRVFPLSTLKRHWKDYSIYTVLKVWHCLHCIACDDLVKYEDLEDKNDYLFQEFNFKDKDLYVSRLLSVLKHFCAYQEIYGEY